MSAAAFKAADQFAREFAGTGMRPYEAFGHLIEVLFCVTAATVPEYQDEVLGKEFDEALDRFERCGIGREKTLTMAMDFINALASDGGDRLGDMAARLNVLDAGMGQFFTPSSVAGLLAQITLPDGGHIERIIQKRGYYTAMDPASGSGGLLISLAQRVRDAGEDPRFKLYVEATELDAQAWRMCYVQLSAYDIPAKVILGNSLTLETRRVLYTPAYHKFFKPRRDLDVLLSFPSPAVYRAA